MSLERKESSQRLMLLLLLINKLKGPNDQFKQSLAPPLANLTSTHPNLSSNPKSHNITAYTNRSAS